jgi:hypothetical protein
MKIVDQTPYYKENGELSFIDRVKAIMEFGTGWFKEIEAQRLVTAVLKKSLDKNYTLLCNIIPPGLDARIPLILVGPTGVYVMSVTPKIGMFRARGDQWGTVSGSSLRPENPNLLTLTEKMARAIQIYLQRQGYTDLTNVEAILLCSDPATTVDSMRPIIRVIMRDSLERFAASIMQARIVLSPESAFNIVNRLLNPPPPPPSKPVEPVEPAAPAAVSEAVPPAQSSDPTVPAFAMPGSAPVSASTGGTVPPVSETSSAVPPRLRTRFKLTRNQVILLVVMVIIWCLIIAGLAFLIAMNMNPPLIMLK